MLVENVKNPTIFQHCTVSSRNSVSVQVQIDSAGAEEEAAAPTPPALAQIRHWDRPEKNPQNARTHTAEVEPHHGPLCHFAMPP